jgi:hypothetical protein
VPAGDEDPLFPYGGNPHHILVIINDFHIWHVGHEGPTRDPPDPIQKFS